VVRDLPYAQPVVTDTTASDQPLVHLRDVGRDYAGVAALHELDLEAAAGQAIALVGHNGSGKTTALTMLAGRLEPTRGKVTVAGVDVYRPGGSATVRSMVSFVPDAPALYADLTVADHVELVGMAHGVDDLDTRANGLLERFDLAERRHLLPNELSRGMRQKTQLACALLRPFAVLVLDEPVSGLDPPSRRALHGLLSEAKNEGAVVMFSTHQLSFAQGLVDRVLVLGDGRVTVAGTYEQVVASGEVDDLGLE
jgi:ABC-2 type transport system ATP-binding protein